MILIRAASLQPAAGRQSTYWPLATPSTGAAELIVARVEKTPGHPGSIHAHDHEEVVVVLAGAAPPSSTASRPGWQRATR